MTSTVATPEALVCTEVALSWADPLVTLKLTIAPPTGFPDASVTVTESENWAPGTASLHVSGETLRLAGITGVSLRIRSLNSVGNINASIGIDRNRRQDRWIRPKPGRIRGRRRMCPVPATVQMVAPEIMRTTEVSRCRR